jgi:predicted aldo/keto reductase-like oxidoreductase
MEHEVDTEHDSLLNIPKLGFGLMRLPRKGLSIDVGQVCTMVDTFLAAGFTYFDTAYVYPGSEAAAKKALVDRYPRESFFLATKLFATFSPTAKSAKAEFETSLKRTGARYFDFYLLHSMVDANYKKYERLGLWDFVQEQKANGLIRHVGFSFHGGPELLDQLLTEHPEVEFVQLQINYADWENPTITSRANYEVARRHGTPIVVMEPVKGGRLANPPQEVTDLFNAYDPDASPASWAIRFAASLDGVITVLSGMSDISQMEDNLSFMKDFKPLNAEERKIIQKAQEMVGHSAAIPCTACRYCTSHCPKQIPIPEIFEAANLKLANGRDEEARAEYRKAIQGKASPADCIRCHKCEQACPQHINVADELARCQELLSESQ